MITTDGERSVVLIGGHDTGKSNYLGRFWLALRRADGLLSAPEDPQDIDYVESLIGALQSGNYAARTDRDDQPRSFTGEAQIGAGEHAGDRFQIVVPDVFGELWEQASEHRELGNEWRDRISDAAGALLFLRLGSKNHVNAIDWISSPALMKAPLGQMAQQPGAPTQVFLTDLVSLLDGMLGTDSGVDRPRLAIIVAGWDALSPNNQQLGPRGLIRQEYPLLDGRLSDCRRVDAMVFGTSITGGDLKAQIHRDAFLQSTADKEGYVVYEGANGSFERNADLTIPVAWTVGVELPEAV